MVIGGGGKKADLVKLVEMQGLVNCTFLDWLPAGKIVYSLSAAVSLRPAPGLPCMSLPSHQNLTALLTLHPELTSGSQDVGRSLAQGTPGCMLSLLTFGLLGPVPAAGRSREDTDTCTVPGGRSQLHERAGGCFPRGDQVGCVA